MGRGILFDLWQQIQQWDRASQLALLLAAILWLLVGIVFVTQPELRTPATIGLVGLTIAMQAVVLWGNRGMVTPYTQAQREFMAGDFVAARETLLSLLRSDDTPDVDAYVLLGNTYRHLSQLDESEDALRQALQRRPDYHFPLYGLGRTLLAQGHYAAAADAIQQALEAGAPSIVAFDLAHIEYRRGNAAASLDWLRRMPTPDEPYRNLMTAYLLHKLGSADAPSAYVIDEGLPFWEAEAARFSHTPYGADIAQDVAAMRHLRQA